MPNDLKASRDQSFRLYSVIYFTTSTGSFYYGDMTKDHGMAAHPQKTNYMIIGTRQKLSRCEESALSLCLDGGQLEQTQRLLGLDIDPSLYLGHHTKLILGKKL
ncbi:unnamed protein product [Porites evermanni]|uniref:Uncharacterized protein n=1 Tax=Porites evermanni TaxID=104178 RepID=A0ABN8S9Q1_9CNID|nr:unnamed protein product [Porites evermanni]